MVLPTQGHGKTPEPESTVGFKVLKGVAFIRSHFSAKKKRWTTVVIRGFASVYLLFFVTCQLTSPTTAGFNDIEKINGTISVADSFNADHQESGEQNKGNSAGDSELDRENDKGENKDEGKETEKSNLGSSTETDSEKEK